MPHLRVERRNGLPGEITAADVVLTQAMDFPAGMVEALTAFVRSGNGWLHVVEAAESSPPPTLGVSVEPLLPASELRVLFERHDHPLAQRLPAAVYVQGSRAALKLREADTETILYTDWHYTHRPVMTVRSVGKGEAACTTLVDVEHPAVQQVVYRLLRRLGGQPVDTGEITAGILGYAPSVGKIHCVGIEKTPGLKLKAVCDLNLERCRMALLDFPGAVVHKAPEQLAQDPEVDLVVVATPPNTHADLCLQMLNAGKHVVCEKPLALSRRETDALVEASERVQRHLGCHQNRRWDPDYVAVKRAVDRGLLGDLFHLETFVGGFNHPCGYWHSHASVSGGTAFDWGAHYLDWIVSLIPQRVLAVVGTHHKRVWHDVTNADQERIQIRFAGDREAEFMHSDIAAVRKPKWYALGTQGAIEGRWRDVTTLQVDPLIYYCENLIPATEMPPAMFLHRREGSGQIVSQPMVLPPRDPFGFHRNLADHLLTGEPLAAPLEDSVKVVTILEAAARSMAKGGSTEVLDD
jgi:predicted dehydrogenase